MTAFTLTLDIDDNEAWSRIFGAEPFTWSWWRRVRYAEDTDWDKAGTVLLTIDDPAYGEGEKALTRTIRIGDISKALGKCPPGIVADFVNDNMDASSADYILQIAVLGELTYG